MALACSAIAIAVCGLAVIASIGGRDWRVSTLVRMSAKDPIAGLARETDPSFSFVHPHAHYDGVYFYAVARDPLARGQEPELIDKAAYRYSHPFYGWLAWIVSGGNAKAVPAALLAVSLAGVAVAAFACSLLAQQLGRSGWWGLIVAASPGIVFSTTADVGEPILFAAIALALLAWSRERWVFAGAALTAVCFTKEPMLLIPVGLLVWELFRWLRGARPPDLIRRLGAIVFGPILFVAWYVYLHGIFGKWPFKENQDFLSTPIAGWVDTFRRAARLSRDSFDRNQIGYIAVALLAIVAVALLVGLARAFLLRTWLDVVFAFLALFAVLLGWQQILYPKELTRDLAVQLALLPAVIAGPARTRSLESDPVMSAQATTET